VLLFRPLIMSMVHESMTIGNEQHHNTLLSGKRKRGSPCPLSNSVSGKVANIKKTGLQTCCCSIRYELSVKRLAEARVAILYERCCPEKLAVRDRMLQIRIRCYACHLNELC